MENIILKKINKNYESDPNTAKPIIELNEDILKLSFELNYFKFSFKEKQKGFIKFHGCKAFRSGIPNDEGFYLSQNIIWNSNVIKNIDFGSFYEAFNIPKKYYENFYVLNSNNMGISREELHHYVFFMKEGTFECIANSYQEQI